MHHQQKAKKTATRRLPLLSRWLDRLPASAATTATTATVAATATAVAAATTAATAATRRTRLRFVDAQAAPLELKFVERFHRGIRGPSAYGLA